MFFRRLKLSHTRCFLPAIYLNRNIHDELGTEVLEKKNAGGWQGVVNAFSHDEEGNPSPDVRAIFSTLCYSSLLGGLYGSLTYSKRAYFEFFEKNQSTLFQNQFEAKSKLQSKVTLAMARGVMKWGTRVALFCGPFTTLVTAINAYNQNISITSYAISGLIIGGFARISMGSKGVAVGSTLGCLLGILVGSITVLILKISPMTMEELKDWQYQSQNERSAYFIKEQRTSKIFQYDSSPELKEHEKRMEQMKQTKTVENKL